MHSNSSHSYNWCVSINIVNIYHLPKAFSNQRSLILSIESSSFNFNLKIHFHPILGQPIYSSTTYRKINSLSCHIRNNKISYIFYNAFPMSPIVYLKCTLPIVFRSSHIVVFWSALILSVVF